MVVLRALQSGLKLCLQPGGAAGIAFLGPIVPLMAKAKLAALAAPGAGPSLALMVQKFGGSLMP